MSTAELEYRLLYSVVVAGKSAKFANWLAHELSKAGYAPSAYCIAAAWHLGLAGYVKLAKAGGESQYGKDVLAIYNSP